MMVKLRYTLLLAVVTLLIALALVVRPGNPKGAVIIDELAADYPNEKLIERLKDYLKEAGYERVDVYRGKEVTVSLYQDLPKMGYELILIRAHSAPAPSGGGTVIFTGEPANSSAYIFERVGGFVVRAKTLEGNKTYFAVTPKFWMEKAKGNFNGAIIVMFSCYGFLDDVLPRVFLMKGASYYVGWEEKVSLSHVDKAAEILIRKLSEGASVEEAVKYVNEVLGPDPSTNSYLRYAKS